MGRLKEFFQWQMEYWDVRRRIFQQRYQQDLIDLPFKIVFSPITLFYGFVGSAPRGFGIPELASKLALTTVFAVGTLGAYDIALEMGKKVLCPRDCKTCNSWQALRCTMCKGTGEVHFQVRNYHLRRGEAATAEYVADAVVDRRAELVHIPSACDVSCPMPSKECPSCDGTGVMSCPECKKYRVPLRISADDIMETPLKAYKILKRMDYPYENIVDTMRDPKIAAFWLLTMPQVMGGFEFDDDVKQKIWWSYKESMTYDQVRDSVARRKPGWEHFQNILISLDPVRARNDPVIVKNIPYYKAKKALEAEVVKLDVPPRPDNWGTQEMNLPLSATSWSKEELKDPKKFSEMTALLNAQREMADKILDVQWETKWRQEKLNELLAEKLRSHMQSLDTGELPKPIVIPQEQEKKEIRRRWWFF